MKIQSPWMGRVRGSAGNMTGSKVYDKNVMRAKAFEVSNPNTTAQQTERNFFAEVSDCVSGVSEAELRSLFGVKPKTMSRRNALTKQVSEAYTIDGTSKTLDFSKLLAIGNGSKVNTPIAQVVDGVCEDETILTEQMFNVPETNENQIILVAFNTDNKKILVIKTESALNDQVSMADMARQLPDNFSGYFYPTTTEDNQVSYEKSFGSFIIKTRAEKKGKDISKG